MDYKEFREVVYDYVVVPTPEQMHDLILAHNSIHFLLVITRENQEFAGPNMENFCKTIDSAVERGAYFGEDFIVTATLVRPDDPPAGVTFVFHSKDSFISDEDFPPEIKRYAH